jgi:hypothetical protein
MKTIIICLVLCVLYAVNAKSAEEEKKNIIYKYKDYESIDLGSLEIKGKIIAPGDLTVSERERKEFRRDLLEKSNFDYENKREIYNLR